MGLPHACGHGPCGIPAQGDGGGTARIQGTGWPFPAEGCPACQTHPRGMCCWMTVAVLPVCTGPGGCGPEARRTAAICAGVNAGVGGRQEGMGASRRPPKEYK